MGQGTNSSGDWTTGAQPVKAELDGLAGYYENMNLEVVPPFSAAHRIATAAVQEPIRGGLVTGKAPSPLPEAINAANAFLYNQAMFDAFFQEVENGLTYMASAVGVIAEMYGNGDQANKASLADIGFAFGDPNAHPTGTPPKGAISYSVEAIRQAMSGAGPASMAARDDQSGITSTFYVDSAGRTTVTFADGSYRQTVTSYTSDYEGTESTTVTTVYNKDGSVFSVTTNSAYTVAATGVKKQTVTTGPSAKPGTVGSVTTVTLTDPVTGDRTITTDAVIQGSDGKPTTQSSTITVAGGDTTAGASKTDQGPIEAAEDKGNTAGSAPVVKQHGYGY
jgi:hypothetical protein